MIGVKFNTCKYNRGGGDTTDGVLARLDEIIYFKPKAVLLIGINDLWNNPQTDSSIKRIGNNIHQLLLISHKNLLKQ